MVCLVVAASVASIFSLKDDEDDVEKEAIVLQILSCWCFEVEVVPTTNLLVTR